MGSIYDSTGDRPPSLVAISGHTQRVTATLSVMLPTAYEEVND